MFVATAFMDFLSKYPKVNGLVSYCWDGRAIEALIVETIELLQEVELGSRCRLNGV